LRRGAVRCGLAPDEASLRLEVASRTDRGVHARANVLALTTDAPGAGILRALNGLAPDLWATRAAPADADFRVRRAVEREYRYFEPPSPFPRARWSAAAACFTGPVDARNFGRGFAPGDPPSRPVRSVTVREERTGLRIDVVAPSFVWGMVRKIVAALRAHAEGRLPLPELRAGIAGRSPLSLPMAEADRLVLWEVRHGLRWTVRTPPGATRSSEARRAAIAAARVRLRVLQSLGPPSSHPRRRPETG
jgi:tRNA pseudouridine38-40 synthase